MQTNGGSFAWRLKYRYAGAERTLSIGLYPLVTLEEARHAREIARSQLRDGIDPMLARKQKRLAGEAASQNTFVAVALDWLAQQESGWSPIHYRQSKRALERDVFPMIGELPVNVITSPIVRQVVDKIVRRGALETAGKVLWNIERIFSVAKTLGLCTDNPATGVREILPKQQPNVPRPALLNFEDLGQLLRRFEAAPISPSVRIAHRLVAFSAARINNVLEADWREFALDGDVPTWTIPRAKMKVKKRKHDHKVILGPTITNDLRRWREVSSAEGFVFPSPTGRAHLTHEAIEKVLRVTLGYSGRHTVHGWRSSFSTLARDNGFSRDVVELSLDHEKDSEVARAYDRGERLEERKKLAAWWDENLHRAEGLQQ